MFFIDPASESFDASAIITGLLFLMCDLTAMVTGESNIIKRKQIQLVKYLYLQLK